MHQILKILENKEFLSKRIIRSLMCLDKLYALIQISIFNGKNALTFNAESERLLIPNNPLSSAFNLFVASLFEHYYPTFIGILIPLLLMLIFI